MSQFAQEITVSAFKTELMNEFGLDEDNDNEGTSSDAVLGYINDANQNFINHRPWQFRLKFKTDYSLPSTTVATGFTTAATTIVLDDTSELPNTGKVFVDGDIISYTNNNTGTNTLTITTAEIDRNHDAGERVYYLHPVPSDYNKITDMYVIDTPYLKKDFRVTKEPEPRTYWEIAINNTDGTISRYLMFFYSTQKQKIYYRYAALSSNLTLTPDTTYIEVPAPYRDYIKESVFARIYKHLEEFDSMQIAEDAAKEILKDASIYDSKQHMSATMKLKTPWDNPKNRLYNRSTVRNNR